MRERDLINHTLSMCDDIDARRAVLVTDANRKLVWLLCSVAVVGGIFGGAALEYLMTVTNAGAIQ